MPLIRQQNGLDFFIESEFAEPAHTRITKENGAVIIRIGIPEKELPHIMQSENISREDIDLAFDIIWNGQEKVLNHWNKIHAKP